MKNLCSLLLLAALSGTSLSVATAAPRAAHVRPAAERQVRELPAFTALTMAGSFNVVFRQGSPQRVEVEALAVDLPKIETEVSSKGLRVGVKHTEGRNYSAEKLKGDVTVYVTVPEVGALSVTGSGRLQVEGKLQAEQLRLAVVGSGDLLLPALSATELTMAVTGSGDLRVGGVCTKLAVSIQGSGDVQASELRAEEGQVSIAGSGDARVFATKTLKANIAGSGDVFVGGNAQILTSRAGSGDVHRL